MTTPPALLPEERPSEEATSSSLPGPSTSSMTMRPALLLTRETRQLSSMSLSSVIPKSQGGKNSLAESLKRRRHSKPIPPTATGSLAFVARLDMGRRMCSQSITSPNDSGLGAPSEEWKSSSDWGRRWILFPGEIR